MGKKKDSESVINFKDMIACRTEKHKKPSLVHYGVLNLALAPQCRGSGDCRRAYEADCQPPAQPELTSGGLWSLGFTARLRGSAEMEQTRVCAHHRRRRWALAALQRPRTVACPLCGGVKTGQCVNPSCAPDSHKQRQIFAC